MVSLTPFRVGMSFPATSGGRKSKFLTTEFVKENHNGSWLIATGENLNKL